MQPQSMHAGLAVQPRVSEFLAFFLSVFSHSEVEPEAADYESEGSLFQMELDGIGSVAGSVTPSSCTPPKHHLSPLKTPSRPSIIIDTEEFDRSFSLVKHSKLRVNVEAPTESQIETWLSARTTPNATSNTLNSVNDGEYHLACGAPFLNTATHLLFLSNPFGSALNP